MLTIYLLSLGAVVLAEMGDKTQLLAMAFATKYKASKVMIGVLIATVFNHALAVAAGSLLANFTSIQDWIQLIAAISFLFFALWTVRGDKLNGEDTKPTKYGPIVTVAIAFFIAEMGDKTQLMTITIAARFQSEGSFLPILLGTTTGMLIADGIGILIGIVLKKKIPERTVKLVSAAAFAVFGLIGLWQCLSERFSLSLIPTVLILIGAAIVTGVIGALLIIREKGAN